MMTLPVACRSLVMFSPLPPQPNGIADYTYELLTGLSQHYNCTVVVEGSARTARAPDRVAIISDGDYLRRAAEFVETTHIYQIGNNPDHIYILPFLSQTPGIVVLHDPSLHHLASCVSADLGDFRGYADALEAEHGAAGRVLGEQFSQYRLSDAWKYLDMPLIRGLIGPSAGTIVHSHYAKIKVLARVPEAIVTVVPHHYHPPARDEVESPAEIRRRLNIDDNEVFLLSLGFVTKSKQIDLALRALASIRLQLPPFKYVIAGELRPEEVDVEALVVELELTEHVIVLGYVDERDFFALVQAANIVINLRYPVGGETSGTMTRALGAGACVIVVDRGSFSEIPDDAAIRLPWGPDFLQRLAHTLLRVSCDLDLCRAVGARASRHVSERNSLDKTVQGYSKAINLAADQAIRRWNSPCRWEFLSAQELSSVTHHATHMTQVDPPLWVRAGVIPTYSAEHRVLCIGSRFDPVLLQHFGYPSDVRHCAIELDDMDLASQALRSLDLVVLTLGGAAVDVELLARKLPLLNRLLGFSGLLVIIFTFDPKGIPMLNHREVVSQAARNSGFSIDAYTTSAIPTGGGDVHDMRCWRLRKVSETFCRQSWCEP